MLKKKTDDLYHKEERVGDPALKLLWGNTLLTV